jgi:hypothetical protein
MSRAVVDAIESRDAGRADVPRAGPARAEPAPARLGEELPVFCERCGYALHGLPQKRCDRCTILHFACPECGHHQPINTLRPAAQRVLGRIRAFVLGLWVFFKLNFFGWLLFAWGGMGAEWSYMGRSHRDPLNPNNWSYELIPRPVDLEAVVAFTIFALAFGMFGRMLLLRWRRGWAVGAVLGTLIILAAYLGMCLQALDQRGFATRAPPVGLDFQLLLLGGGLTALVGAVIVWPVWMALAHLFLPTRTAAAMLQWQRNIPAGAPALARQE